MAAWEDWRSREVSCWILGIWLIPGLVCVLETGIAEHLRAAMIGAMMLLLSRTSGGSLGKGDGLFFLMTACYLDFGETLLLFLMSLGISSVWGMAIFLRRQWGGRRCAESVPFLACAWPPGVWLILRHVF